METYETVKKFLAEGGRCLLIENGKPLGVVLTMEEFELLRGKSQISNLKSQTGEIKSEPAIKESVAGNPIGEAMIGEMDFPGASAALSDIDLADDITLEDLGIDELPY